MSVVLVLRAVLLAAGLSPEMACQETLCYYRPQARDIVPETERTSIDLREEGLVNPVAPFQERCQSCWAYVTACVLENAARRIGPPGPFWSSVASGRQIRV